ncbi:hypothetical protein [Arcticibacter sp.]|uniref:hypothetical protein n=1 Tax=Arcticibacter sp. TaxID=1872630 RepID=UPI00388D2714
MELENLTGLTYHASFSKKEATQTGVNLANDIFDRGEKDPLQVLSNIVRLKQVIDSAEKVFRDRLNLNAADSWNGVTFTPKNGSEKLQYSEDHVVAELEEKLKQRKELVKVATKSKDVIFDSDGNEVTKVSTVYDKSSIVISF